MEIREAEQALDMCPHEAIQQNGMDFEWDEIPARPWRLRDKGDS
jgi:hypothetical protein